MTTPRNWEKLTAGFYVDEHGAAHIVVGEMLRAAGYPDNQTNRETLQRAALEICKEQGIAGFDLVE